MSNLSDVLSAPVNLPKTIPDGWKWQSLVDVCRPKQWKTISQNELTSTGFPVFGANGFIGYFREFNHAEETIAVTCRGATCGTVNLVPPKTYITGNAMCLDDVTEKTFIKYLYYAATYRTLSDAISGSAQPQITGDSLKFINIPFPPLPEQKKIASILTSVDEVIEKTQSQIDKLQDLKKGTMNELLTKGIGHTEFKDSELGRIPKSWEVKRLGDLIDSLTGGVSVNSENRTRNIDELGILKTSCISKGEFFPAEHKAIFKTENGRANTPVEKDRIIFSRMNTPNLVGESGYVEHSEPDLFLPDRLWLLDVKDRQKTSMRWLSWLLASRDVRTQLTHIATGTSGSMKNISKPNLLLLPVRTPKIHEQNKISSVITSVHSQIRKYQQKLHQTQSLKKSLMQDLLTGKVRVSVN